MMAMVLIQKKRVRWADRVDSRINGRYVPQHELETDWQIFVYNVKKFLRMNIDDV